MLVIRQGFIIIRATPDGGHQRERERERKEYGAVSNRYQEVEQEAGWYQYHVESIVPSQGLHIKEVVLPTM